MNIPIILKELAKVGVVALTEKSVKTFVETKIKPIFENWGKGESRSIELEECLSEYLLRCYAKNNIMTTIVFGRLQKTLEDLYIPLTLEEYRTKDNQWIIDEKCYDILDDYSRILIVDMAGMGKSTIVKYFACQGINLGKSIPIVIELRKLEKNQSILKYIQLQINSLDKNIEIEEIVDILKKGDFAIFFDGYDEIANENKASVLESVQEFADRASNIRIVITSREEEDLNSLGEYKCFQIKPLNKDEAYQLIKKYDNVGETSKKLIMRLEEDLSMELLREFLINPLLVSLLYKTFEYKEEIPYKKIDFYEQVYAALFNDHDKTKGSAYVHDKKSKLDKFQFEKILRVFGFLSLKSDKVEYSDQLIHQLLEQSIKRFNWLKISVEDFLYDITHSVPFIQKDGNEYKWVHKSFMEYFASCFMCYDNKESLEKYLIKMTINNDSLKYYNILDFCYDMDTLSFRKYIILPYLEKHVYIYDNFFKFNNFKSFDKAILHLAKQIFLITNDIHIVKYNKPNNMKKFRKYLEGEIFNKKNIHISENEKQTIIISFKYNNLILYKFMIEKIPDLFDDVVIESIENYNIKSGEKFYFNDDINNPINKDQEIFSEFLKIIGTSIFDKKNVDEEIYRIINYKKCREIIKEINEELEFQNNVIFDL